MSLSSVSWATPAAAGRWACSVEMQSHNEGVKCVGLGCRDRAGGILEGLATAKMRHNTPTQRHTLQSPTRQRCARRTRHRGTRCSRHDHSTQPHTVPHRATPCSLPPGSGVPGGPGTVERGAPGTTECLRPCSIASPSPQPR
eukprot:9606-Chlamydomonas_euryale.AAC.1